MKQQDLIVATETAIVQAPLPTLMQTIQLAVQKDASIETLERLWALKKEADAIAAKQEYGAAMADVQAALRSVAVDSDNPQTRSKYASYRALDAAVRPIYSRHGFAVEFNTEQSPLADHVRIICDITHKSGHTERKAIDMPNDGKGAKGGDVMTKTHATGSAVTYGMRYLLKMAFNIAVGEDDNDGNGASDTFTENDEGKPQSLDEALEWIGNCRNLEELKNVYFPLYKQAQTTKDKTAMQALLSASNRRKRELGHE